MKISISLHLDNFTHNYGGDLPNNYETTLKPMAEALGWKLISQNGSVDPTNNYPVMVFNYEVSAKKGFEYVEMVSFVMKSSTARLNF